MTALSVAILSILVVGFALQNQQVLSVSPTAAPLLSSPKIIELAPNTMATSPFIRPSATMVLTLPTQTPTDDVWHTGVVKDILSSRNDYSTGRVWEDNTHRNYRFMAGMAFKRWERVKFKLNTYGDVIEIARLEEPKAVPAIKTVTHGLSSVKASDSSMRIVEGTILEVHHDRNGKTMGIVRTYEGRFVKYTFESSDYYKNNQRVRIKLDLDNHVVAIELVTNAESRI